MSYGWTFGLSVANVIFTGIFLVEAVLKLIAIGPRWYFRDRMNQFDFAVVVASIITIGIDFQSGKPSSGGGGAGVNLLRVLRVARLFRLIRRAKGIRQLIQTLLFSLPALYNVGTILFVFIFIFAVMGMQLFGTAMYGAYVGRQGNFDTFAGSMLTLFRSLTGEPQIFARRRVVASTPSASLSALAHSSLPISAGESWPGLMHDCAGDNFPPQCFQMVQDCNTTTDPPCPVPFVAGYFYNSAVRDRSLSATGENRRHLVSITNIIFFSLTF